MPEYLEMTADKFTFRVAKDRLYSAEGVWILPEPDSTRVRMGLADYSSAAQWGCGVRQCEAGRHQAGGRGPVCRDETIKAMVDLHARSAAPSWRLMRRSILARRP